MEDTRGRTTSPDAHFHESASLASLQLDLSTRGNPSDMKALAADSVLTEPQDQHDSPRKKFLCWRMTKMQRVWAIVGLVLLLLLVLFFILWFAILPAVVSSYADSIEMSVNYMDVTSIPDDSTLSMALSLNLQHDVSISATTDATTISLLYAGAQFATLAFPALDVASGKQNYNLTFDSDMEITDQGVFDTMADALMSESEITLTASASLDAHALGMSFSGRSFTRELTFEGFGGFSDPAPVIEYIDVVSCSDAAYVLDINVTLDNTARMGLDAIGALNMTLYYNEDELGFALSQKPELGMPRGVSDQVFRVTVDPNAVSLSTVVLGVLAGSAQFFIVGDNPYVTTHAQFEHALANVNMTVPIDGGSFSVSNINIDAACSLTSLVF